jgi:hypothetical protein
MFGHLKLGLQAHDPARVALVAKLHDFLPSDPLLAATPRDWQLGLAWDPDCLGNDTWGNCGPAAAVNLLKTLAALLGIQLPLTVDDALKIYRDLGWDGTFQGDKGVVLLDLMNYLLRDGVAGVKFDRFFSVGFGDPVHLASAVAVGGPLLAGLTLPVACQTTDRWDAAVAADKRIWGGHAVEIISWSPGLIRAKSWGKPVDITPDFLAARCNEMYLAVSEKMRVMSALAYDRLLKVAEQL